MRVLKGVVYMMKGRGPRTEPREHHRKRYTKDERLFSHLTRKQRDDKWDLNQLRTEP